MKKHLLIWCAACSVAWAQPQTILQPEAFAHRSRIELGGAGPFHQLELPLAVYRGVQRHDLGDLRVFNGRGEVVPHALIRIETAAVEQTTETAVPFFPIVTSRAGGGDVSVEVRRNTDGTLVAVRQSPAAPQGQLVRGIILDASRIKDGGLRFLRLETGPTAVPFHPFTLETSDDLQQWRLLKADAQLVRLEHAGQRIQRDRVEWSVEPGKYFRILWSAPEDAPAVKAIVAGKTLAEDNRPSLLWSEPIAPTVDGNNAYDFALPGRLPLEQVRILLPQPNTLVPVQIQQQATGRSKRRGDGWWTMQQAVVFRLQSPQGELHSPDIVLNRPAQDRLRLTADQRGGGIGEGMPMLQIGFVPQVLVFLGRGEGPFTLAWGAAAASGSALPAATLIPGYRSDQKLSAAPASLKPAAPASAAAARSAKETPLSLHRGVLWAVLIAGIVVLAAMARTLLNQMQSKEDTPRK